MVFRLFIGTLKFCSARTDSSKSVFRSFNSFSKIKSNVFSFILSKIVDLILLMSVGFGKVRRSRSVANWSNDAGSK